MRWAVISGILAVAANLSFADDRPTRSPGEWVQYAAAQASRIDNPRDRAIAWAVIAGVAADAHVDGLYERAARNAERGLRRLEPVEQRHALYELSQSHARAGQLQAMFETTERIDLADMHPMAHGAAAARAVQRSRRRDYDQLIAMAIQAASELEPGRERDLAFSFCVWALIEARDDEPAIELARMIPHPARQAAALALLAAMRSWQGDERTGQPALEQAIRLLEQAEAERADDPAQLDHARASIAEAYAAAGQLEKAREIIMKIELPISRIWGSASVARALARDGAIDEARQTLADVEAVAVDQPIPMLRASHQRRIGEYRGLCGLAAGAEDWIENLTSPLERALAATGLADGMMTRQRLAAD